ncbi:MAG: 50S ribosomal protein L12 [Candidatus Woesearchaeota archaeon]|nr:50S ribosomal protein L12 [Candidatus Woesearchaeota archaeon]
MEYVYGAMLLHKAGQDVNQANMKKVLKAAGVKADEARIKALVAALNDVDIDKAITQAAPVAAAAPAAASEGKPGKEEPKEEEKEEEKVSQEEAAEGLGSLFG